MVQAARHELLRVGAGLLLITLAGCTAFGPEHGYLVTGAASIGSKPGLLQGPSAEERLANESAELVGWWTGFNGIERLIVESCKCELRWWEKWLVWALPIAINVVRTVDHLRE